MNNVYARITAIFVLAMGAGSPNCYALEHWYLPVESQLKTLVIENPETYSQDLWISGPIDQPTAEPEVYYSIPAKTRFEIATSDFQNFPWIHLKAKDDSTIKINASLADKKLLSVKQGNSDHWQKSLLINGTLLILNTSAVSQNITVSNKGQSKKYPVPALSKLEIPAKRGDQLDIQGEQKITALLQSKNGWEYLQDSSLPNSLNPVTDNKTAYFLFTNSLKDQSFVVKTDNEDLKEQARNQIAAPHKYPKRILVASIALGHDNNNRDFYHKNKSPWSWHVSQAITFADFASQDCDGSPEFIDEFAKVWTVSPATICFWGYKVSTELSLEQIRQGSALNLRP